MRPLERSLVLANLLTLGVWVVPRLHAVRWTGFLALLAVLIAGAQLIVEGPRWQMVPAYLLTGLFFVVWLVQGVTPAGRPVNRLAFGLAIGLATVALLISAALPIAVPVFRFPLPTGPYAIGTVTYHWVDGTPLTRRSPCLAFLHAPETHHHQRRDRRPRGGGRAPLSGAGRTATQ